MSRLKPEWGAGAWDGEPDEERFEHAGVECLLRRHQDFGNWCGYARAGVRLQAAWDRSRGVWEGWFQVHGGVTHFGSLQGLGHAWVGFDCAHADDLAPGLHVHAGERPHLRSARGDLFIYRDVEYARSEVRSLAEQVREWQRVPAWKRRAMELGAEFARERFE